MGSRVDQVTQERHYSLSGSDRILGKNAEQIEFLHSNRTDYKLQLRIERQRSEDTVWLASIKVACAPTRREEGSTVVQYRGTKICRWEDDGWTKQNKIKSQAWRRQEAQFCCTGARSRQSDVRKSVSLTMWLGLSLPTSCAWWWTCPLR
jgi:hypothetical protein